MVFQCLDRGALDLFEVRVMDTLAELERRLAQAVLSSSECTESQGLRFDLNGITVLFMSMRLRN